MNGGRSDASTSTDDVKSRPLCLFYFTHPFGVLSAEPPTLAAAPPHIARAFLNMEPVPPWTLWSPAPAAPPPAGPSDDDYNSASSSRPSYELGAATVHRTPLSLVSVTRTRKCTLDFGNSRDSISSSLFSSDIWFNSSSSCRSNEYPRRLVPYNKILPPLQLPSPKDSSNLSSCDDFWPKKCLNPEKFSLPPIELPSVKVNIVRSKKCSASSEEASSAEGPVSRDVRARRRLGVSKPRRARAADLRRLLATLMRRALAEAGDRCQVRGARGARAARRRRHGLLAGPLPGGVPLLVPAAAQGRVAGGAARAGVGGHVPVPVQCAGRASGGARRGRRASGGRAAVRARRTRRAAAGAARDAAGGRAGGERLAVRRVHLGHADVLGGAGGGGHHVRGRGRADRPAGGRHTRAVRRAALCARVRLLRSNRHQLQADDTVTRQQLPADDP